MPSPATLQQIPTLEPTWPARRNYSPALKISSPSSMNKAQRRRARLDWTPASAHKLCCRLHYVKIRRQSNRFSLKRGCRDLAPCKHQSTRRRIEPSNGTYEGSPTPGTFRSPVRPCPWIDLDVFDERSHASGSPRRQQAPSTLRASCPSRHPRRNCPLGETRRGSDVTGSGSGARGSTSPPRCHRARVGIGRVDSSPGPFADADVVHRNTQHRHVAGGRRMNGRNACRTAQN